MSSRRLDADILHNFITCFKLPLFENIFLGSVTFQWTKDVLVYSKPRRWLNILAIVLTIPIIAYIFHQFLVLDYSHMNKRTINQIIVLTNTAYISTLLVCGYFNCGKCIDLLSKLIEFDGILKKYGTNTSEFYVQRQKYVRREFVLSKISVTLFILCVLLCGDIVAEDHSFSEITRCVALASQAAVSQLITEIVNFVRFRYAILNARLRKLILISRRNAVKTINGNNGCEKDQFASLCRVCDLHHRLYKITAIVNETFGFVLLLMFAANFTIIVIYFFFITAYIQRTEILWKQLFICIFFCAPIVFYLVSVCNICYRTTEEAHQSGELIHKIETNDSDMIDEIEMFSLQIANHQVQFNAAGFFTIDRTLLFSIIGGVTTYIIILMQVSSKLID